MPDKKISLANFDLFNNAIAAYIYGDFQLKALNLELLIMFIKDFNYRSIYFMD